MPLFLLRLRAFLGWGVHPDVLRARSTTTLRLLPGLIATIAVSIAGLAGLLPLFHRGRLTPGYIQWETHFVLFIAGAMLLNTAVFLVAPSLISAWLARRDIRAGMRTRTIYGRCFAIRLDPHGYFFARIGLTRDTARWYSLPPSWDEYVTPSKTQVELEVLPVSGWVQRLSVLGTPARVLTQSVPEIPPPTTRQDGDAEAREPANTGVEHEQEAPDNSETGATKEAERALRQFARHADLGWKTSPTAIAWSGWMLVIGGSVFALFLPALLGYIAVTYPSFREQMGRSPRSLDIVLISLTVYGVLGLAAMIWGYHYLRAWRRLRRPGQAPPVTVSGEVVSWVPYRDMWSPMDGTQPKGTLIELRLPDGQTHIFRIPIRFLHRVRRRGQRLRITYVPTTERVLDVVRAEALVGASRTTFEQG